MSSAITTNRKMFRDLSAEEVEALKDIYFPIFDKTDATTYEDAYKQARLISGLSESATRNNMERLFQQQELAPKEEELVKRKQKLDYEAHKLQRERLVFKKTVREQYDSIMLLETFKERLYELDVQPYDLQERVTQEDTTSTILLSDLHIGKYDKHTHRELLQKVVTEVRLMKLQSTNVVFVGDVLDGLLRMSQLKQIKTGMVGQVFWANELLIEFLENLSNHVDLQSVYFVIDSNHQEIRPLGSNRGDFPEEDLGHFVAKSLEVYCNAKNLKFVSGGELEVPMNGEAFKVTHGHQFKGKGSMYKFYENDNLVHGHFHTSNVGMSDSFKTHIGVPALCYGDEYTKSLGIKDSYAGFIVERDGFFKVVKV